MYSVHQERKTEETEPIHGGKEGFIIRQQAWQEQANNNLNLSRTAKRVSAAGLISVQSVVMS